MLPSGQLNSTTGTIRIAKLDRFSKLPIYAAHGVSHCWLLDPNEKTLEVFILANGTYTVGPTFIDNNPVTAPPFEAHTFELDVLWTTL